MNGASANAQQIDVEAMRARANGFICSSTVPRYETIQHAEHEFYGDLGKLISEIQKLTVDCAEDDARAKVALVSADEAHRRRTAIERAGLHEEFERVKQMAQSVVALCDHSETLSGTAMCLVCDKTIKDADESVPYDRVSPSGSSARSGRIHSECANAVRRS